MLSPFERFPLSQLTDFARVYGTPTGKRTFYCEKEIGGYENSFNVLYISSEWPKDEYFTSKEGFLGAFYNIVRFVSLQNAIFSQRK